MSGEERATTAPGRICGNFDHTTDNHQYPELSASRKARLVRYQVGLVFVIASSTAWFTYLLGDLSMWYLTALMGALTWPASALVLCMCFYRKQWKENQANQLGANGESAFKFPVSKRGL